MTSQFNQKPEIINVVSYLRHLSQRAKDGMYRKLGKL